jgi:hypothetical protein
VGFRDKDQKTDLPYYSPSVGSGRAESRTSHRFIRLEKGVLHYSSFLSPTGYYRLLDDKFVRFPVVADPYFGVISRDDKAEDANLSRQVFGATASEYDEAVKVFGQLTGKFFSPYYPSVTCSKNRVNLCDITGCLIPRLFPYIAFDEPQFCWSHVSLLGFCRVLAFLTPSFPHSGQIHSLIGDSGISAEILGRLVDVGKSSAEPLEEHWC